MTPEQQQKQADDLYKAMSALRVGLQSGPIVVACVKMILVEYVSNKDPTFRGAVKDALAQSLTTLEQNS